MMDGLKLGAVIPIFRLPRLVLLAFHDELIRVLDADPQANHLVAVRVDGGFRIEARR